MADPAPRRTALDDDGRVFAAVLVGQSMIALAILGAGAILAAVVIRVARQLTVRR